MSSYYQLVDYYVQNALTTLDTGKLILAVLILVLIYTVSEMMIFLAAVTLGRKFFILYGKGKALGIVLVTIICSYLILTIRFDYTFALATPLVITVIYLVSVYKMNLFEVKLRYQAIILFQLILAIHWLEVNPFLQQYGFGKSETVYSIIDAAYKLQSADTLQLLSIFITTLFTITFFLSLILIHINILRNKELALSKIREEELQKMKISAMESRFNYEMHSLVHDLKTPLTTISGLISLLELQLQKHKIEFKASEYIDRIDGSIKQLNEMISEMLYESARWEISLQELVNYTRANFIDQLSQSVNFTNHNPDAYVYVNRIGLVRALINLIENAVDATKNQDDGEIDFDIRVTKAYAKGKKQEGVLITITDNGEGISEIDKIKIWDVRFSTKGSSGLGLPFVKKVINDHNGWIKIDSNDSKKHQTTKFTLFLPKGSTKNER
ncbi:HAMP domain-containing sensor histidine kinase [Bacillaceae bacterium IKA-2]|nr:HAMP domain-containing sensor histidine kinase [Bacillaceae bacterium IKA-2]